jgi:hypothetical protein
MYKKIAAMSILAIIALILVVPTIAQAAGSGGRNQEPAPHNGDTYGTASNFVDADGDGVCDDCQGTDIGFVDADGDGVCDNCRGTGVDFVDADGDGVCDNMGIDGQQVKTSQSARNRNQ